MENQRLKQLFSFLEKDPADPFTLYSIGYEYVAQEDWPKAKEYLEKVLEADPAYLGVYFQLGKCLRYLEDDEQAMAVYRTGMDLAKEKGNQHTFSELQNALMNTEIGEDP